MVPFMDSVELIPGEWYLLLKCPNCRREYIVVDPSQGKWFSEWIMSSSTPCANCQSPMYHNARTTERYQHPANN